MGVCILVYSTKEMDKIEFENGKLPIAVDPEIHRQHLDQLTKELETRKRYVFLYRSVYT